MFMLSGVIVLLGAISLLRLPVDLMPELQLPSITIRVGYPGVGPREMEESITRPIEQAVSAVAGLEQINVDVERGPVRHPPQLRLGHQPQRRRRRRAQPHRSHARPPARGRRRADPLQVRLDRVPDPVPRGRGRLRPGHSSATSPRTTWRRGSSACRASPRSTSTAACAGRSASSCRARRRPRSTSRSTASSAC